MVSDLLITNLIFKLNISCTKPIAYLMAKPKERDPMDKKIAEDVKRFLEKAPESNKKRKRFKTTELVFTTTGKERA